MGVDYNKVFPEDIAQGVLGGPEFLTDITQLRSGAEYRNTPWTDPIHKYNAGLGIRGTEDLYKFQEFFFNARGMLKSFRFKDWSDYRTNQNNAEEITAFDQRLGVGDGTTYYFRTYKEYSDYNRRITNPRIMSCKVGFNHTTEVDANDFFVDDQNGVIVFREAPPLDTVITWGGEYDIPVRFDSDYIPAQLKLFNLGSVPDIPITEVRVTENIVEADYLKAIELLGEFSKEEIYQLSNVYDYTVNTHWDGFWELKKYLVT